MPCSPFILLLACMYAVAAPLCCCQQAIWAASASGSQQSINADVGHGCCPAHDRPHQQDDTPLDAPAPAPHSCEQCVQCVPAVPGVTPSLSRDVETTPHVWDVMLPQAFMAADLGVNHYTRFPPWINHEMRGGGLRDQRSRLNLHCSMLL